VAKPDQDDTGQCVSCGFLAVSPFWGQDPSLREVDRSQRQNAQLGGLPVCFAQAEDLTQEVLDLANLGVALVRWWQPDAVVLDVNMPDGGRASSSE
jgi:hypothetical protein